jgi:hypothetical protein
MKRKEIYLVVAASMLVVAGWAAWRFTATDKVVEPSKNASLPGQQTTPPAPKTIPATAQRTTGKATVSETTEKVEIAKKRLSEDMSRAQAELDIIQAGPRAVLNARRIRTKPEDMGFLKSLGLSDELRDKVYDMLTAKADLYWVHEEKIKEAAQKRETYTGYINELRQMEADIEAAVGTENYGKIRYYERTPLERLQTARFKSYLQSRSLPLTEQQEAAVVDAMVQGRAGSGKASFALGSPSISMGDKLAYIDRVKQSLGTVLNANDMAFLEQYLKEVAESPQKLQALNESIKKRAEERKMKASNPPTPPR